MEGLIEKHIPKKKYLSGKRREPWINRDIINLVKKKHKAWGKYRKNNTNENWSLYTQTRNHATHEIEKSKQSYEQKLAADIKTNPKFFGHMSTKK